jgi:DNA-binding transcriptional MocR family regulator
MISLAYGLADPLVLPREELVETTAQILATDVDAVLNYAPVAAELVTLVAERLRREGVDAHEQQVLITYGSSQILGLLPQVLVNPGDTILVEAPTFMGAVGLFVRAGARLVGVPVDANGLDVDALETALRDLRARGVRPKFIYTIPTFQNPTGTTLSLARRQRIVALAAEYGVIVVEDDAYSDLRFHGEPLPPMAALDQEGWVLRMGTFSKILAPGLRVGWAHGPKALIDRLRMVKVEGSSSPFVSHLVACFSAEGRLDTHIASLRRHYATKCATMITALHRELPELPFVPPDGGFFIWLRLPEGVSGRELEPVALQQGVEVLHGNRCYADGSGAEYVRLAFSYVPETQIEEAIRRLGHSIRTVMG